MSERGSISSTYTIIILIGIAVIAITLTPLIMTANKVDNASQASLQATTTDFVNEQCSKGRLSKEELYKFIETVTGPNTYDVEIEVKVAGENPGKKASQVVTEKSGENTYTTYYTSQVLKQLDENKEFKIGKGGQLRVYLENTNTTTSQELTNSSDTPNIIAEAVATCNTD